MPATKHDPVQVYLDSKDISYLADSEKLASDASLRQVRDELIELARNGIAEFRFSFFNVIELAHLAPEHKPHAVARGRFVKELCGNRAFMHPDKLRRFEALSLIEDGHAETAHGCEGRAYVADARWLPESIVSVTHVFTDSLIKGLHNRIAKQTRKELDRMDPISRAVAEKKLFNEQGVTKDAADIAATIADAFFGDWPSEYPLTPRFWDKKMLLRYLQGEVSLEELKHECLNGFADVDNFIGWCVEIPSIREMVQNLRSTEPSKLFDALRNDADQRIDLAEQLLEGMKIDPKEREQVLRSLREDLQAATTPDLEKVRREELEELYETNQEWFATRAVTKERFDSKVTASAVGAVPSLDVVLYGVTAHFRKLAKLSANHPKLKRSDLADLIHCSYVPYSDVFSVDRRTRELIAGGAALWGTQLIEDTKALPEAIRTKAQSGSRA
jgi:hypothetical protein